MQPFKALNLNLVHGYHIAGRGFSDSWVVNPGVRARGNCDAIDITDEGHAFIVFDGKRKWIPMGNIKGATPVDEPAPQIIAIQESTVAEAKAKYPDRSVDIDAAAQGAARVAAIGALVGSSDKSAHGDANKATLQRANKKAATAAPATTEA